jgi:putative membrane protein
MVLQSLAGLPAFLVYFCTATVVVLLYLWIYTLITPYNEFQLIRDNVPGAAVSLGLSLVGFSLPLISAIIHAANIVDCVIWGVIALTMRAVDPRGRRTNHEQRVALHSACDRLSEW